VEYQLSGRRRLGRDQPRPAGERSLADVMVDARDGVGLFDGALQVAEAAQLGDVEYDDDVRRLDLLGCPIGAVGPGGKQKVEPLGDGRRVRDRRFESARGEEVPE